MAIAFFRQRKARAGSLPGFGINMGFTLTYLSLIVLIPLSAVFIKSADLSWDQFWNLITSRRVLASLYLTFGMAIAAALINAVFGLILAWVLVRYQFPFRRIIDALIDLPFALPTAVAGIALASMYAPHGWIGQWLPFAVSNHPPGILVAMTFISLPFVVRTVQPVLQDLEKEQEEVALCLGANRFQTVVKVVLPAILPALLTGVALAFARAVGEYGSIIFIAGNTPLVSEITALVIVIRLEQYDYAGASAIAVVMLLLSFFILLAINLLQWWLQNRERKGGNATPPTETGTSSNLIPGTVATQGGI